jgi:hypothetical protein
VDWASSAIAFQEDVVVFIKAREKEGMTVMHKINSHSIRKKRAM